MKISVILINYGELAPDWNGEALSSEFMDVNKHYHVASDSTGAPRDTCV